MDFATSLVSANKRKKNRSSYYDPLPNESSTVADPTGYASQDVPLAPPTVIPPAPTGPTPLNFNPTADAGIDKGLKYADPNKGLSQSLLKADAYDQLFDSGQADVYDTNVGEVAAPEGVNYNPNAKQQGQINEYLALNPNYKSSSDGPIALPNEQYGQEGAADFATSLLNSFSSLLPNQIGNRTIKKKKEIIVQ